MRRNARTSAASCGGKAVRRAAVKPRTGLHVNYVSRSVPHDAMRVARVAIYWILMAFERSPDKRLWKIRLYPSPAQETLLVNTLAICCDLYNATLQERRDAYRLSKKSLSLAEQCRELTQTRADLPWVAGGYQEAQANVLRRVNLAFAAFFRRCKAGEKPGYPRFKSKWRYNSVTFPHGDRCIAANREAREITVPRVGTMRYRDLRGVPDTFTQVAISRCNGRWYACFETVIEPSLLPDCEREVGVDVGIANLAALSTGALIANPRHAARERQRMLAVERSIANATKRSKRQRKLYARRARKAERIANQRRDAQHKLANALVRDYGLIVFENLSIGNMTRSAKGTVDEPGTNVGAKRGLNREILGCAWSQLITITSYKAAEAGRHVALVSARNTSRTCHACGHCSATNRRSQAVFVCEACGRSEHADINAARNILARFTGGERRAA